MMTNSSAVHTVAIASYEFAGSTAVVVAAIVAAAKAGQEPSAIRAEFMAGRIARAILAKAGKATDKQRDVAITKGLHIVAACEPGRKAAKGQATRTAKDQELFEPTKRWWSRMGRDAGVIKARKTGGTRKVKAKAGSKAAKPFIAKAPKDASAALLTVQNLSQQLAAYTTKFHDFFSPEIVAACNHAAMVAKGEAKAK
jgi:hypothetical protein